jgi:hypothetical protein
MKSFKNYIEEVAANAVAGGGVDLTPSADQVYFKKRDKRKKEDSDSMFRRSQGLKFINAMLERKKKKYG